MLPLFIYTTPTGGNQTTRKNSLDNTAIQIELNNRQTEEFRQIVQENNDRLIQRIYDISTAGDKDLLHRMIRRENERDKKLEDKITDRLASSEAETIDKIENILTIRDDAFNRRLGTFEREIRTDLSDRLNTNDQRLKIRISELDNILHEEISTGLRKIDDAKTKMLDLGERMEEFCRQQNQQLENNRRDNKANMDHINTTMTDLGNRMTLFENTQNYTERLEQLDRIERENTLLRERMSRMENSQTERFEAHRVRMNQIEENSKNMRQEPPANQDSSQFVSELEIDHKNLNLLVSGLPTEYHSIQGTLRFAYTRLNLSIAVEELTSFVACS